MARRQNLSGMTFRGFELRRQIGIGGFGSVYNAYQEAVDREVAVKVIHPEYSHQADFVRRFEAEARIIARLEHLHIVPLYDYWRDPSGAFLVMRWLRGGSARTALDAYGPWPVTNVARLLTQIAGALSIAHYHGIIHRDLKPENILMDESDNVYLSDFGISVDIINDPDDVMMDNLSFGSPAYMSPEQLTNRVATPLADIYSLGILVYELLTSDNPFPDETTAALMKKQVREPIPSLAQTRPELPPTLDVVIWRATAKTPSARYQDVKQMAAAFLDAARPVMEKETEVPMLNSVVNGEQDGLPTSGLFGERSHDPSGTVELIGPSTKEVETSAPSGESRFGTIDLGSPGTVFGGFESGDSTLDLSSAFAGFGDAAAILGEGLEARNPYKGLRPFEEFDAGDFYGRRSVVNLLLDLFEDSRKRFLAVVGPSGSGKSSLVKAGFIPELRQGGVTGSEQWFIVSMVPGDDPFRELAEALLRVAFEEQPDLPEQLRSDPTTLHRVTQDLLPLDEAELLIFIDQFEEIFTVTETEQDRINFLQGLVTAVSNRNSKIRVVITLRADFYDRPLQYSEFGHLLKENTEVVLPLSPGELEETITEPASKTNLILEGGLSKKIVDDVYHQPGALPLLQYALTELYERRNGRILEHKSYQEIGGVSGALAKRAGDIYDQLNTEKQEIARQLFLRLVTVEGQSSATRKRQIWKDLLSGIENRQGAEGIINEFAQFRLLTLDRDPVTRSPTVEIAHEALITAWEQLGRWIEASRSDLQRLQRLQSAAADWTAAGQDSSFLARGTRLADFEALAADTALALGDDARAFIDASIQLRLKSQQRTRMVIAALTIFSIIALIFAIVALIQQQRAQEAEQDALTEADRANRNAMVSRSRELALTALLAAGGNDLSLLLSVQALQIANTFEARNSLLTALQDNLLLESYLHGHQGGIRDVRFSGDGSTLVSGGEDGNVLRWDTTTLHMIGDPLLGHEGAINAIAISNDAKMIASAGQDQLVRIWDAADSELLLEPLAGHESVIWSLDISPSGNLIATGDESGTLILWDAVSGEILYQIDSAHDDRIYDALFSPSGNILATASADQTVRLWNPETGEALGDPMAQHNNWVMALAFSPDGRLLYSSGADETVIIWDVEQMEALERFDTGHNNWIRGISVSESGQVLATASLDGSIRLWNIGTQQMLIPQPLRAHRDSVWAVAFQPDAPRLVSAATDGNLLVWSLETPFRPAETAIVTSNSIEDLAINAQGDTLATIGAGQAVELWDAATNERLNSLNGHTQVVNSVAFNLEGTLVASASTDMSLRVWDIESGQLAYAPMNGHGAPVWSVAFTPDGREIVSGADNGTIIHWDAETGQQIGSPMETQTKGILAMALSPDGQTLAAGGRDSSILLIDRKSGETIRTLTRHNDAISALAFSRDGRILASASRDINGGILLWDVETGQTLFDPLTGHSDWVLTLAISPDNQTLASAGRDGTIILWDLASGRMLGRPLQNHSDWVNALVFSPDGEHLYSAGRDAAIIRWSVSIEDWILRACRISNRNFDEAEWQQYSQDEPYHEICTFEE